MYTQDPQYVELLSQVEKKPFVDDHRLELANFLDGVSCLRGQLIREQCSEHPNEELIKELLRDRDNCHMWAAQDLGVNPNIIPPGSKFEFHKGFAWWPVHTSFHSFSAAIAAGRYDHIDPHLTASSLCIEDAPVTIDAKLVLYAPSRRIFSEAAIWEMRRRLNLHVEQDQSWELCAFGEKYPDVQGISSCVALGSICVDPRGRRSVPYLDYWDARRKLYLGDWGAGWCPDYRFLAARDQFLGVREFPI